jgi:hypothetical protein
VKNNPFDVNAASSYGTSVDVTKQFHHFPGLGWHSKTRKLSKEFYLLIAIAVYVLDTRSHSSIGLGVVLARF